MQTVTMVAGDVGMAFGVGRAVVFVGEFFGSGADGWEAVAKLDSISMRAIEWVADDDAKGTARMSNAVVRRHHIFLYNDLGANGVDQV